MDVRRRSSANGAAAAVEPTPSTEPSDESFRKLFASVLDPQTQDNHQRHLALTKNVLYQNELGWKLAELPMVNEFLLLLRDKVLDAVPRFAEQLLHAVVLCGKPFVRQKSNEEISNPSLLTGLVPTIAQLLSFEVLEIQVAAAEALRQFATGACLTRPNKSKNNLADATAAVDDLRLPTRVFSQNIIEETGTVDLIVGVFHDLFPEDAEESDPSTGETSESQGSGVILTPRDSTDARPITPSTKTEDGALTEPEEANPDPVALRQARLDQLLFPLVDLVHELSSHQRCAEVLVVTGALHYTVYILGSISLSQDELLPLCLTTLWNVLELCEEKTKSIATCSSRRELLVQFRLRNAAFFLSTEFTFQTLLATIELLLVQGYRRQDKEMRNECLMILLLLARRQRSLPLFYSTGLTACLLSYATSSELARKAAPSTGSASAIVANFHHFATNADEDMEFKQTLWLLLSVLASGNEDSLTALVQFRFLDVLLDYATGGEQQKAAAGSHTASGATAKRSAVQNYSLAQLQILQSTALSVLNNVAPFLLEHFYEINGHITLLEFLQSAVGSEDVLTSAWLLMLQVSPATPQIQDELGRQGAVETALAAFTTPPSRHTFAIRRNAILTCAQLCHAHDGNRRRFFRDDGVTHVTRHLAYDAAHSVLEENLLIGIVEAVRACVIGHAESELAFVHDDGVAKLLDVLVQAPKAIKHQVLAALAEICVNPAAIPTYTGWRSDQKQTNNATASQVLLHIYANEEEVEDKQTQDEDSVWHGDADAAFGAVGSPEAAGAPQLVSSSHVRSSAFRSIANCKSPFVLFPPNAAEELSSPTSPVGRPTSPAFARLKEALRAAQTLLPVASGSGRRSSLLDVGDADFHPQLNLKAKIHAVLANLSFACDHTEKLSPKELVMLEIAKEYPTFRLGELWQNVQLTLHAEGVRPIYADALYIRKQIEHAHNIAICTKHAQKEIFARDQQGHDQREAAFFESILRQKQQEEQAEAFHRANRRQNSTMKLHLDAKATRLELMKRQDPTAFMAYEKEQRRKIEDPPPVHEEELSSVAQKERELRGRLSTIQIAPHTQTSLFRK